MGPKIKVKLSQHQKGQNVTFTPTTKACEKEYKGNRKDNFSPFLGSIGWKKEWYSYKSKIVRVDELSKLTNNGVVLFWKKRITKFGFVCLFISIIKINIISKFAPATNNVMYVPIVSGLYQRCPAI